MEINFNEKKNNNTFFVSEHFALIIKFIVYPSKASWPCGS